MPKGSLDMYISAFPIKEFVKSNVAINKSKQNSLFNTNDNSHLEIFDWITPDDLADKFSCFTWCTFDAETISKIVKKEKVSKFLESSAFFLRMFMKCLRSIMYCFYNNLLTCP